MSGLVSSLRQTLSVRSFKQTSTSFHQITQLKHDMNFIFTLAALFVSVVSTQLLNAADRPNILFVFADDWGRYASAYGAAHAITAPHAAIKILRTRLYTFEYVEPAHAV